MQINRFAKIVTVVTSLGFTFFSCIALFDLLVLLFVFLFCLLCQNALGVFRLCGGDLRWLLAPLKIPSPAGLSWTSLWGALYAATAAACYPPTYGKLNAAALIKIKNTGSLISIIVTYFQPRHIFLNCRIKLILIFIIAVIIKIRYHI